MAALDGISLLSGSAPVGGSGSSLNQRNIRDNVEGDPENTTLGDQNIITKINLDIECSAMRPICRGCLSTNSLANMLDTVIGGVVSTILYEDISKIKIEGYSSIPATLCKSCFLELERIDNFIKLLKQSYTVLVKASQKVHELNEQKKFYLETNTLKSVTEAKNGQISVPLQTENSSNVDDFSDDNRECSFSAGNDTDSSDDDQPLLKRVTNIELEDEKTTEVTSVDFPKFPLKKRGRKRKENCTKSSEVTENIKSDKNVMKSSFERKLYDKCPLCAKNVRYFVKHIKSIHSVDWKNSKCLKCSYQNTEKNGLIDHCKSNVCKTETIKDEDLEYVHMKELKIEFEEEHDRVHSGEQEDIEEAGESQPRKKVRKRNYSCIKCEDVSFTQYEDIERHLKTVHHDESKCILCEEEFTNSYSLLYHMMVKHGKLKCCRLCLLSFQNSEELNTHYKSEEHNTKCTVCEEQFKNRKALYEHRRKKHLNPQLENQKFKCPECPKEFSNQNNIRRHILVSHNDLRFLCDTCGQSYTTKRNLTLHIQKFHQGVQIEPKSNKKNFFCEACGRELKIFHKFAIAMHRAKHKGHNFVCRKCYDSFPTEKMFKEHVEDLGHQLYECDKCQAQFVREENLKSHLKNHDAPGWNKNMFATWGKSAKLRNEKGEFVCTYCPKVFKDKQRLDNHTRVHTNERPYKCHICSKGFKTWIHRKTHLNIHLGIKKWVCKYCSKAFTNSCTLKGHEMIHTGERPHRCPDCKKGFITMSAMKKHRMVHFRSSASGYGKKDEPDIKEDAKTDSDREENNGKFMYKYGQIFTGSDSSYESFIETKEHTVQFVSIENELSC